MNGLLTYVSYIKIGVFYYGEDGCVNSKRVLFNDPIVQSERLLLWIGSNNESLGSGCLIDKTKNIEELVGASNWKDLRYLINQMALQALLEFRDASATQIVVHLTFAGWNKFRELNAGKFNTNRVFMAMRFGQAELDVLFGEFYKPALQAIGFDLFRLDEEPKAGSITNRMRVAIKESKFVIADLSYGNRGAYWEAGFGEGLGKHVIYSVNESTLDEDHHFDVQGQQAVIWTADKMEKAAKDLEACVKATFF